MSGTSLEGAIYAALAADAAVSALVGTRIYPVEAPQGTDRPFVIFSRQEQETLAALTGRATHRAVQVAVMCIADDAGGAMALGRAVRDALDGIHGADPLHSVRMIGRMQAPVGEIAADPVVITDTQLFNVLSLAA